MELAQTHAKEAGIMVIPSEDYYDEDTPDYGDPWFRDIVENVSTRRLRKREQGAIDQDNISLNLSSQLSCHRPPRLAIATQRVGT